jgi:hypothetical protein
LSTTITVCVQVALFPQVSVAVHTTRFVPFGKTDGALLDNVTDPEQFAWAEGLPKFTFEAVHFPASVPTVIVDEQLIDGGVVLATTMIWVAVAPTPQEFVADHVRVITLLQLVPGLLCVSANTTFVRLPPQSSVAVTPVGGATLRICIGTLQFGPLPLPGLSN